MRSTGSENNRSRCSDIPQPDLTKFKDNTTNELVPDFKMSQVRIKTNNLTATWNDSVEIPLAVVDKLIKNGISWRGVVSPDDKTVLINGSFSFPLNETGTNGHFELKYNDLNGSPKLPNNTEIWSPVYTSNDDIDFVQERNKTHIPIVLYGNKTSEKFIWNGHFSVLQPKSNTSLEINAEKMDYQFNNSSYGNGKNKRTWRPYTAPPNYDRYAYFNDEVRDKAYVKYLDQQVSPNDKRHPDLKHETNDSKIFTRPPWSKEDEMEWPMDFHNTTEVEKRYPEIFKMRPLRGVENAENEESEKTCKIEIVANSLKIEGNTEFGITPPVAIAKESYTDKIFVWRLSPHTNSLRGNFTGNQNGTFALKYQSIDGCSLNPDCVYYSRIVSSPIFEMDTIVEAEGCTRIAPVIFDEPTWNGSITIVVRELPIDLKKENELSLNPREIRHTFKNVTGIVSVALDGEDLLLWNNTLPVVFKPRMNWFTNNDTVAYPISWSGFYIDTTFVGSFLLAEKQDDNVVWHDGQFSINLGNDSNILQAFQVYTTVVYLTTKDDVVFDLTELEEMTDWDLNQYARIILKGNFSESKFHWFGELTLVLPKIVDDSKSSIYRPYIRYAGKVIGGTLYAEMNDSKYLWWSGVLPPTVLIPSEIPRGYKQVFDQKLLWTFTATNSSAGHALFITHGNQSQVLLSGDFDFHISPILTSPSLSPNTTYYSPIILQQNTYDLSDDIAENLPSDNSLGTLAPITLLGKYLRKERLFAWNGKFIISVVSN